MNSTRAQRVVWVFAKHFASATLHILQLEKQNQRFHQTVQQLGLNVYTLKRDNIPCVYTQLCHKASDGNLYCNIAKQLLSGTFYEITPTLPQHFSKNEAKLCLDTTTCKCNKDKHVTFMLLTSYRRDADVWNQLKVLTQRSM